MAKERTEKSIKAERRTPDLTQFPNLVVVYLGMKVKAPRGIKTVLSFGPKIQKSVAEKPDGLLLHENMFFSLFPLHAGMRQYWRDFESLEQWTRSGAHKQWWQSFVRDTGGTGFWHELYVRNGEMEGAFLDMTESGMTAFAPTVPTRGTMFSARRRLRRGGEEAVPSVFSEEELYGAPN
ncbi:MAG TPA: phenylacetaldoxime dehydratase family protein [Actinomycetota bacterium]|nr:phenylacetaldoxime dehydratase family protein [Actinomycetota bacterium]